MPKGSRAASASAGSRMVRREQTKMKESIRTRRVAEQRREMVWTATTIFQELADWSGDRDHDYWHKLNSSAEFGAGSESLTSPEEWSHSSLGILHEDDDDSDYENNGLSPSHEFAMGDGGQYYDNQYHQAGYYMDEVLLQLFIQQTFGIGVYYTGTKPPKRQASTSTISSSDDGTNSTESVMSNGITWNEYAFQMAQVTAYETSLGHCEKGKYTLDAAIDALDSYIEYLKYQKMVERIFRTYNRARDGYLKRSELLVALQDRERRMDRSPNGIIVLLLISPKDMDIIMEEATMYSRLYSSKTGRRRKKDSIRIAAKKDKNKKNKKNKSIGGWARSSFGSTATSTSSSNRRIKSITRSELLPAIKVWERLAQQKLYGNQVSLVNCGVGVGCRPPINGCTIL